MAKKKNSWMIWGIIALVLVPLFFILMTVAWANVPTEEMFYCAEDKEPTCLDKDMEYVTYDPDKEIVYSCRIHEIGSCYNPNTYSIFTCLISETGTCLDKDMEIYTCKNYERGGCYDPRIENIFTCLIGERGYCM